jgi:hypothetical protein
MKAKREEFWSMLEYTDPDIIIAMLMFHSSLMINLYVCISKSSNKLVLRFGRPQLQQYQLASDCSSGSLVKHVNGHEQFAQ